MSDKYIAIGSIGTFLPGDEVTGLDDERYAELLELGKVRVEQGDANEFKSVNQMTVKELEIYIKANGGDFAESDNKPELLIIAQDIEEKLADNKE